MARYKGHSTGPCLSDSSLPLSCPCWWSPYPPQYAPTALFEREFYGVATAGAEINTEMGMFTQCVLARLPNQKLKSGIFTQKGSIMRKKTWYNEKFKNKHKFLRNKRPSKFQISWSRQVFTFKPRKTCLPPCSSNITTVLIPTSLLWRRGHITTRYWQEPQRRFQTGFYCTYGNRFKDVCCRRHAAIHWAPARFFKFFLC